MEGIFREKKRKNLEIKMRTWSITSHKSDNLKNTLIYSSIILEDFYTKKKKKTLWATKKLKMVDK